MLSQFITEMEPRAVKRKKAFWVQNPEQEDLNKLEPGTSSKKMMSHGINVKSLYLDIKYQLYKMTYRIGEKQSSRGKCVKRI